MSQFFKTPFAVLALLIAHACAMPCEAQTSAPRTAALIMPSIATSSVDLTTDLESILETHGRHVIARGAIDSALSDKSVDPYDDAGIWRARLRLDVDELVVLALVESFKNSARVIAQITRVDGTWRRTRDVGEMESKDSALVSVLSDVYADLEKGVAPTVYPGASERQSRQLRDRVRHLPIQGSFIQVGFESIQFTSSVVAVYGMFEGLFAAPVVFDVEFALTRTESGAGVYLGIGGGVRVPVGPIIVVPTLGVFSASGGRDLFVRTTVEARYAVTSSLAAGVAVGLVTDLEALANDFEVVPQFRFGVSFRTGD